MDAQRETIIVTGANGLIGSAVAARLCGRFAVAGFVHKTPPSPPHGVECVHADLTSDESVERALARVREQHGSRIASVIHLAAYYDFSGEPSHLYHDLTVKGTERLLRGLQAFQVEQFIFSSTMLVHKPSEPGHPINEEWPLEPKWAYPQSKVETERVIAAEHGHIPALILRIAGVYDDNVHSIPLAHQMQRIYEHQLLAHVFPGDVSHGQAFVHLDDVVDLYQRAVERRKQLPPELTLLVGEPRTVSYDELQRGFARQLTGEEFDTHEISKEAAKLGAWVEDTIPAGEEPFIKPWMIDLADDHYELDISRARSYLGWQPKHSLVESLPVMASALRRDPLKWYADNHIEPPDSVKEHSRKR